MPLSPYLRALTLTAALALGLAGPAHASRTMRIGIGDDGVTQRTPGLAPQVIPKWKAAGADVARVLVIWSYVAPKPDDVARPAGFDPSDPGDPGYNWGPVDESINTLLANGIEPILTVTAPGPVWGSQVPSQRSQRYKPDPAKFAVFAKAVAQRYADRVGEYILYNEPNIDFWLQPQMDCVGSRCTPAAPAIYRNIANRAIPAIKAGDPGAKVYFAALAPGGKPPTGRNNNLKPLPFLRALGCVDTKLRRERTSKYCRSGFEPLSADGLAYHPHGLLKSPVSPTRDPERAGIADIPRLLKTLDGTQKAGGFLNAGSRTAKFDLFFTEFGYQTNPPDPYQGVSLREQNAWLQRSAFIAWKNPRVKMLIQYLWQDDPVGNKGQGARAYAGWQSGLHFYDGRPKPARKSFPIPFWVDLPRGRRTATIWGQVRPGGAHTVKVQSRRGGGSWSLIRTTATDSGGFFSFTRPVGRGTTEFRFQYTGPDERRRNVTFTSSPVKVTPRG